MSSIHNVLRTLLQLGVTCVLLSTSFHARSDATNPVLALNAEVEASEVTVQQVRPDVFVLFGAGGNIGLLETSEGKLLVDAGIASARARILKAMEKAGSSTPRFVVNTHWHWDHTEGNGWLNEAGAVVVAHEKTRGYLNQSKRVIEWAYTFPAVPRNALPSSTFLHRRTIRLGQEEVVLRNFGSGHTDGDALVYFKESDVMFLGDVWWNGHYPFIDYGAGGGIDGMIRWTREAVKMSKSTTIVVPGHGAVGTRGDLIEYRDMLLDVRRSVATLKRSGRTLAEVIAARPTARYDAKWGRFLIGPEFFVQLVYMGI